MNTERLAGLLGEARRFLLCKRDLYYRPDNCGYTGIKDHAGRYLESDASPESGVTAIHEDDAPMFSKACFDDLKVKYLLSRLAALEEALTDFCLSAECAAGVDEGASHDVASSEIMSAMGSAMAASYDRARATLAQAVAGKGRDNGIR